MYAWLYIYVYIFFLVSVNFNWHHQTRFTFNFWCQRYIMIELKCDIALFESQIWGSCYSLWKVSLISKCQKCSLTVNIKQIGYNAKMKYIVFSHTLRKKCLYSELFWSVFSRIPTEFWEIRGMSSNAGRCRLE